MHSAVPDRVRGVRFLPSANENTLSVEWSRPRSDAPILYYEIRSRQRGHSWQGPIRATTEMVTILTSLVRSASYGVQVRAVSAIGAGPYSREVILEGLLQYTYTHVCMHFRCTQAHNTQRMYRFIPLWIMQCLRSWNCLVLRCDKDLSG